MAFNSLTNTLTPTPTPGSWPEKGQQASNPSGALSGQQEQASFDRIPTKVGVSPFPASEGDLGGFGQEPWEGGYLKPARLVLRPLPLTDVWD